MDDFQYQLTSRILSFEIDRGEAETRFVDRLADENGWSAAHAGRVVNEYKRFIALAVLAGHSVAPSDQVDQAWHLHLTDTRSYWDELCGRVLGRPLHHDPTLGRAGDGREPEEVYRRTIDSYLRLFGEEPPPDIWPPAENRPGCGSRFRRVDLRESLVLSRAGLRRAAALAGAAVMGAVLTMHPYGRWPDGAKFDPVSGTDAPVMHAKIDPMGVAFIVFGLFFVGQLFYILFLKSRCRHCGKWNALCRTGEAKRGGLLKGYREEMACKYCHRKTWISVNRGGGQGGGTGGSGGSNFGCASS